MQVKSCEGEDSVEKIALARAMRPEVPLPIQSRDAAFRLKNVMHIAVSVILANRVTESLRRS
jgi:hypothetical protein